MEKINIANRIIPLRFSMLRRITTLFYLGTRTCVRCIEYGVTAITYGVTTGRVLKKADGLPSYTSFLSKHARCRNRQRSRILRSCRPHESAGCYISKAAEYMSLSSSPENTLHFILFIWILFWIYFFQTHRLFYLTVTRKLIIEKYKYCKRFAECNSSKNFVSL